MDKQRVRAGKPSKLFVYLPVYLGDKLQRIVIQDRIQLTTRIEVGDSFAIRKRDNLRDFLDNKGELKVVQVKYGFMDGSCIAVLEKLVFKTKKEVDEFLKNKRSV
jgi:hypothetical protein